MAITLIKNILVKSNDPFEPPLVKISGGSYVGTAELQLFLFPR